MSQGLLRVFCLANGNLKRDEQVARFDRSLSRMVAQAEHSGPWMFAVYTDSITSMKLYE
jgi:hypothetical protein